MIAWQDWVIPSGFWMLSPWKAAPSSPSLIFWASWSRCWSSFVSLASASVYVVSPLLVDSMATVGAG
jgi:hypothetical protein